MCAEREERMALRPGPTSPRALAATIWPVRWFWVIRGNSSEGKTSVGQLLLRLQKTLYLARRGHRRLRTNSRHRNCRNCRSVPSSLHRSRTGQKTHSEPGIERVSRRCRIHSFHCEGRYHLPRSAACSQKNTLLAHLDHNVLRTLL